jgi:hypothetical protein
VAGAAGELHSASAGGSNKEQTIGAGAAGARPAAAGASDPADVDAETAQAAAVGGPAGDGGGRNGGGVPAPDPAPVPAAVAVDPHAWDVDNDPDGRVFGVLGADPTVADGFDTVTAQLQVIWLAGWLAAAMVEGGEERLLVGRAQEGSSVAAQWHVRLTTPGCSSSSPFCSCAVAPVKHAAFLRRHRGGVQRRWLQRRSLGPPACTTPFDGG